MKTCKDCNKLKHLYEFTYDSRTRDGRTNQCKECLNSKNRALYEQNPSKFNNKQKLWRRTTKGKIYLTKAGRMPYAKAYKKKYAQNNKEKIQESNTKWKTENKETYALICRKHAKKTKSRRRNLGFVPLNKMFDGADAHHINKQHIIYMPRILHKSIPHSQTDLESMRKINILAIHTAYI